MLSRHTKICFPSSQKQPRVRQSRFNSATRMVFKKLEHEQTHHGDQQTSGISQTDKKNKKQNDPSFQSRSFT